MPERATTKVFMGIHMAGPKLNAETFKQGMFNYPESGGGLTNPHVSYGDHGYFKMADPGTCTSNRPRLDFLGTDDVTEIWWDANAEGPDERGKTDKKGMWRYANNGKRYLPGTMPKTDIDAFEMENTVTIIDKVSAGDAPPSYPSPAKKPSGGLDRSCDAGWSHEKAVVSTLDVKPGEAWRCGDTRQLSVAREEKWIGNRRGVCLWRRLWSHSPCYLPWRPDQLW